MTPKERAAMQQALEAFESAPVQYDFNSYPMLVMTPDTLQTTLTALREALADQAECPHGVDDGACKECYMEQAEQEPVAYFHWDGKNCKDCIRSDCGGFGTTGDACSRFFAAPVRTKDLTDDEIAEAVGSPLDEVYLADFRAVIAADRRKNHG